MYKVAIAAIAVALTVALGACGGEELGTPGTGKPNPGLGITPGPATADPASGSTDPNRTPTNQDAPDGEVTGADAQSGGNAAPDTTAVGEDGANMGEPATTATTTP